jgi:Ca-activated chloride channel family protein
LANWILEVHMFRARTAFMTLLALFAIVALPRAVPTQATSTRASLTLKGSVVDSLLKPLPGVTVSVERQGAVEAKTTTDERGLYTFAKVAPGPVRVRAELKGYDTFTRDVTLPADTASTTLAIVLIDPKVTMTTASAGADASGQGAVQTQLVTRSGTAAGAGGAGGRGAGGIGAAVGAPPPPAASPYPAPPQQIDRYSYPYPPSGETYSQFDPNRFQSVLDHPLSTFGADVDTASYSNIRRFLSSGQLPPSDAVRLEELVNYFHFGYAAPRDGRPIALTTEIGDCPWAPSHKLVLIGARAAQPAPREITGRNIVLLIDVSGSMAPPERLPLIKTALGLFVDTLKGDDTLSIVTYAGTSGLALPPTSIRRRDTIQNAIASLSAGGSTNGGEGLILAYRVSRQAFIPGGVNRVILATDGDFNVGMTSQGDLYRLIERERDSGVFLSVFGVGSGNLKDATMEMLADRGNGNYAYLDSLQEARRVLIREGDATLEAVAKDVKFQVEFNPAVVSAYKLLGYENRALAAQDFNNDRKDAGEMGAGHTVTVLYEVIPAGNESRDTGDAGRPRVDPLKYQQGETPVSRPVTRPVDRSNGEWLTVKTRYKLPESDTSELMSVAVRPGSANRFLPLASTVAEFALALRDTPRDAERWRALSTRAARLSVPADMISDVDGLKELIATAQGLARIR